MEYLDFELPIKELEDQLTKCKLIGEESDVDVTETCQQIESKLEHTRKEIFKNFQLSFSFISKKLFISRYSGIPNW